jgi:hypothetical protein
MFRHLILFLYICILYAEECIIDGVSYFECRDAAKFDKHHEKVSIRCEQCNYDIQCCNYTKYKPTDPECGNHGRYCPKN